MTSFLPSAQVSIRAVRYFAIAAIVVSAAALTGCVSASPDNALADASAVPTVAEAQASFDEVFDGAQKTIELGNWKRFCDVEADDTLMCEYSLNDLESDGTSEPSNIKPAITFKLRDDALIGTVRGKLADGSEHTTQLQFVRSEDGKIRPVDAVFWNSRSIITGSKNGETSSSP